MHNTIQYQLLIEALSSNGFAHLQDVDILIFESILKTFGEIIQTTDITVKQNSKALVTSAKKLDFHTDHHKADIIAWYCFKQTDEGGENIFIDTELILSQFSLEEKEILSSIKLYEHKIFKDDKDYYPLITKIKDRYRFYYSFWLVDKNIEEPQKSTLNKFREIIRKSEPYRINLKQKDVLLVDNGRILHGRTEIKGSKNRYLKRYWVSCPNIFH